MTNMGLLFDPIVAGTNSTTNIRDGFVLRYLRTQCCGSKQETVLET